MYQLISPLYPYFLDFISSNCFADPSLRCATCKWDGASILPTQISKYKSIGSSVITENSTNLISPGRCKLRAQTPSQSYNGLRLSLNHFLQGKKKHIQACSHDSICRARANRWSSAISVIGKAFGTSTTWCVEHSNSWKHKNAIRWSKIQCNKVHSWRLQPPLD